MLLEVARFQPFPPLLFLIQKIAQSVGVVGLRFAAYKLPKLRVGAAVKALRCGLRPAPMLIMQGYSIGGQRLFRNVLKVLRVIQFIKAALNFPALCACDCDGIGKDMVAGLLPVKPPCVVLPCVFEEHVAFPEAVRPGRARQPQKPLIPGGGACRRLSDNLFVNFKIILIKCGVLPHDSVKGSNQIHVFKLIHTVSSFPNPATCSLRFSSAPFPCRL